MPRPVIAVESEGIEPKRPSGRPKLMLAAETAPEPRISPERVKWPKISRPGVPAIPDVSYYIGDEVCFSPMFGNATLFVISHNDTKHFCVSSQEIIALARTNKSFHKTVNHIYLAANRSYRTQHNAEWMETVSELLGEGYYVSLEINLMQAKDFIEWDVLDNSFFCLVMRYALAKIERFRNAAIRLEDEMFCGSNGGVWTHAVADLTVPEGSNFTPWQWFSKDKPLK